MLDSAVVEKIVDKYPKLEVALLGGVVSMKMIRELIDIDRWLMQDIYKELIMAQAVEGVSSSCFKATKECRAYLQEHIIKREMEEQTNE